MDVCNVPQERHLYDTKSATVNAEGLAVALVFLINKKKSSKHKVHEIRCTPVYTSIYRINHGPISIICIFPRHTLLVSLTHDQN